MSGDRIILGTAKIGMPSYGFSSESNHVSYYDLFCKASELGVLTLDTSPRYGNAEELIGAYHKKNDRKFLISTKVDNLIPNDKDSESAIFNSVKNSINKAGVSHIEELYLHQNEMDIISDSKIISSLLKLKNIGMVKKIGVSIYNYEECKFSLESDVYDMVQIPINIMDTNIYSRLVKNNTFSTKEPETLRWIEEFGDNDTILFDIGANIGIYSIYHSLVNRGRVVAFEPSFFNLKLLAKNINVNNCQHLTTVITNPLSSETRLSNFKYGSTVEGGALSAFGVDFGYDGEKIQNNMQLNVLGVSLDWMFESQIIDVVPNLVKIDVDGIEHIVLQGAKKILEHVNFKSVLVEVNDAFKEQSDKVAILLESFDFILRGKFQGDLTNKSDLFSDTFNQIWVKK